MAGYPIEVDIPTKLDLSFSFDSHNIEAEAGNFEAHSLLGWTRNTNQIELDTYNGLPVFIIPDDDGSVDLLEKNLNFQDIQNLHLYGGVFGGRTALDIPNGDNGMGATLETEQATSILNADGVTYPFSSDEKRRFRVRFEHDGTNVIVTGDGITSTTLDGIGTVNVIDWDDIPHVITVPKVFAGEFFDFEIHIQNGLNQRNYLYLNGILIGHPTFAVNSGGVGGNRLLYTSGSIAGTNRITYIRKFGATVNTSSSELLVTKEGLENANAINIIIPNGTRNYSVVIDKNLSLPVGYTFNFLSKTTGRVSWIPTSEEGISAVINGFATGNFLVSKLTETSLINTLKDGANFVMPEALKIDFSRFNSYLPTATPYTTPTLAADTPTKLIVPLTIKTERDFSFDATNLRQYFDAPGVTGRWFLMQSSATITTSVPNQTVTIETYVNGVIVEGLGISRFMTSSDVGSLVSIGVAQLSHLDYVEIFITLTSAGTITFERLSVTINEMVGAI